ncbi:carotenoid biosynthesis protein [Ktedonosporobacter rubrisoli]|uniref:Carotenoid biosynthesis protein n=1 Tax=Ktedonosporobacter rubrisoli TaxID=2509675 RepID=A0A4P6JQE9_KTERU|nr:carotenoid biosynthesis protein [Ktedonosporobacter rubrisoli]QBD77362.1 carotenoid biosynthesis protein [Ktedonosporobacter rubrisoli]
MKAVKFLFCCHLAALVFGLGGLLIAMPHPELWDRTAYGAEVFNFGIRYAGSLHILLGAATMLLFGLFFIDTRKTLIFFCASTLISLSMELLGTSTGFPFGPYAYTNFLGGKILGHVPYSIPLSWFYMGFTSFLLAHLLIARTNWSHKSLWSVLGGAYLLTVWDLTLDPSMTNNNLPIHFWVWYTNGLYFGMPISNLLGWSVTGLIYTSVSRVLWRSPLDSKPLVAWLPFGIYAANTCFAIVLNLSSGLILPPVIGILLGLLPASLTLFAPQRPIDGAAFTRFMSHLTVRVASRALVRRKILLTIEGVEWIPQSGPVLIAARHFHHLYDGCILLSGVPRRLHILVAPDWIKQRWLRSVMERACEALAWPILLRAEQLAAYTPAGQGAYSSCEVQHYLRCAVATSIQLLRSGEALVIFPEAYPTIDPIFTPKQSEDAFLPFRAGFARLTELAERDESCRVAIIPAGLHYKHAKRWQVTLRLGQPLFRQDFGSTNKFIEAVEERVHALSTPSTAPAASTEGVMQL